MFVHGKAWNNDIDFVCMFGCLHFAFANIKTKTILELVEIAQLVEHFCVVHRTMQIMSQVRILLSILLFIIKN